MFRLIDRKIITWLDSRLYPNYQDQWDDSLFRLEILSVLRPDFRLLDLGAGAGILPQMDFRGRVRKICGVDVDGRISSNSYLDDRCIANAEALPYASEAFDVVFANNVLEHLTRPELVFKQVARVLRSGGYFLVKTPNRHHYVPLIGRLTSRRFQVWVKGMLGRSEEDTFRTVYAANTPRQIRKLARGAGFVVEKLRLVEGRPEYCRLFSLLYVIGAGYERVVNSLTALAQFRVLVMAVLRKDGSTANSE